MYTAPLLAHPTSRRRATSVAGLILPFPKGRRVVSPTSIVRLEGDGNYTTFWFADGTYLFVAVTLKRFESRLSNEQFVRVHRKHLVNRAYVEAIDMSLQRLTLTTGEEIEIARRRVQHAKEAFQSGSIKALVGSYIN
jgi:two-component system, LytTR family, response regulator